MSRYLATLKISIEQFMFKMFQTRLYNHITVQDVSRDTGLPDRSVFEGDYGDNKLSILRLIYTRYIMTMSPKTTSITS